MAAKFWHRTLEVEDMALMRDFYTRLIGLEETGHVFYQDPETSSSTPGAIQYLGLNEFPGVSWDMKVEEQRYKDENHDLVMTLQKFHNKPSAQLQSATSFFEGHVGFTVDHLPSVLQSMVEEQLGEIIQARGPDGAPNRAYIYDPEGNALELRTKQPDE